jgi:hypothetical protein
VDEIVRHTIAAAIAAARIAHCIDIIAILSLAALGSTEFGYTNLACAASAPRISHSKNRICP